MIIYVDRPTERDQPGRRAGSHEFKQVESCFINRNTTIHFCCTDSSLLMTHRGGLSLSIIIWKIGGGGPSFLLPWGPKILLAALYVASSLAKGYDSGPPSLHPWQI